MTDIVIDVADLSKKYRVGVQEKKATTLLESITDFVKAPVRNYRQIRNLSRLNGEDASIFWALRDISFDVKRGEVVGIIGHNGAGKSTLLKILSRITDPTAGEATITGRVSSLLEVGTGFHPELTGRENVYLNGTILGMRKKEIDAKFDEILAFSGVEKHLDTPVKFYSSGMRVRLGFAVAAHLDTEILIIDEVLAVGDAEFQKKCLGKMESMASKGRTVLFVSHNMEAVRSLCSRAILLDKGSIAGNGEVNTVINQYLSKHKKNSLRRIFELNDAPGTENLKLTSCELLSSNDGDYMTVKTELRLLFKFTLLKSIDEINLSLVLYTLAGNCIFNVATQSQNLAAGEHESELVIPGNLLNDDIYTVELFFVQYSSKVIFRVDDTLTFEVLDVPRAGNWYGKWIGAVRPDLNFYLR